jgi:predicted house-cleaning noncanonical NTP pyrophosphatase (MazG superfamily)
MKIIEKVDAQRMKRKMYNKLVRDKIPEIIEKSGKYALVQVLSDNEFEDMLDKKLQEEVEEYLRDGTVEEFADIQEVLIAILDIKGISNEEVQSVRLNKLQKYGGFSRRIFLKEVHENPCFQCSSTDDVENDLDKMVLLREFVKMVNVQEGTIRKYLRDGQICPDSYESITSKRKAPLFKISTVHKCAQKFGWELITDKNIEEKFIQYIEIMDMSFSYKPVLIKAIFDCYDNEGNVQISDVVDYYIEFYESRRAQGLVVEKGNSIFSQNDYTHDDVELLLFRYPFDVMSQMSFVQRCEDSPLIRLNPAIFERLTCVKVEWIKNVCNEKIKEYYLRNFD